MSQPKELTELEQAIRAFQNLAKRDPNSIRGLRERLEELAKDIVELTK